MSNLTENSTIKEVFDFLSGAAEEGAAAQVTPITFKQDEEDTRLGLFIKGTEMTASMIFAVAVDAIEQLYARQQQEQAEDESPIITR